jgi:hypothetical protein
MDVPSHDLSLQIEIAASRIADANNMIAQLPEADGFTALMYNG